MNEILKKKAQQQPVEETNLIEALNLSLSIIARYRSQRKRLTPKEKNLVQKVAEAAGLDLAANAPARSPRKIRTVGNLRNVEKSLAESKTSSGLTSFQASLEFVKESDLEQSGGLQQKQTSSPTISPARSPVESPRKNVSIADRWGTLRQIVAAQSVYKTMMKSREELEQLSKFAVECSATIKLSELAKLLSIEFRAFDHHYRTTTYVVTDGQRELLDPRTGLMVPIEPKSPLEQSTILTTPFDESGKAYFPIVVENEHIGTLVVDGVGSLEDVLPANFTLMQATVSIAGLSLRNARIFEVARWQTAKAEAMLEMANRLAHDILDEEMLVRGIIETAKQLAEADQGHVYIVHGSTLRGYHEDGRFITIPGDAGIPGLVNQTREIVNIRDAHSDPHFDPVIDEMEGQTSKTILCIPVFCEGAIVAVAELVNKQLSEDGHQRYFTARDENVFKTFSTFIGVCLRACKTSAQLNAEKRKSELVLDVVKTFADTDIRDVNTVVEKVIRGSKRLLSADRSSLFLFDEEHDELYSKIADATGGREIRFPSGKGIAGAVAQSGIAENIEDAYSDPRFNRDIDKQLGYKTVSLLCEPITCRGQTLAVAQLVNKLDPREGTPGPFSSDDQQVFRQFALFAGISLSNAKLLEFAVNAGKEAVYLGKRQSGQRGASVIKRTAGDGESLTVSDVELAAVKSVDISAYESDVTSRKFNLFRVREENSPEKALDIAAKLAFVLIMRTGLPETFHCSEVTLLRFICLCRRRYRTVPYHNFFHAVDVCQTIYTYLYEGRACEILTEIDCFVLLAVALSHDLDHMGLNNNYHLKTDSPLGILSSATGNTSVLEVHHCNIAVEILEVADIFGGLDPKDQQLALRSLIDSILATDMARHGELLTGFIEMNKKKPEDVSQETLRATAMVMLTKAGDISNVTKPFEISRPWAICVTEEFFRQGDKEREKGYTPQAMFDRALNAELAKGQLGFINFVARRFFEIIVESCFGGMQWCLENIRENAATWEEILAGAAA